MRERERKGEGERNKDTHTPSEKEFIESCIVF